MHEADEPDALVDLPDTDLLAGKGCTEVRLLALEAGADVHDVVVERVIELGKTGIALGWLDVALGEVVLLDRKLQTSKETPSDRSIALQRSGVRSAQFQRPTERIRAQSLLGIISVSVTLDRFLRHDGLPRDRRN